MVSRLQLVHYTFLLNSLYQNMHHLLDDRKLLKFWFLKIEKTADILVTPLNLSLM